MSNAILLKASVRDIVGKKVKKLRKDNLIPAVMYGHKIAAQNLTVNNLDFQRVYDKAGESALIELEVAGKKVNALIHDLQHDPMSGKVTHVDFFQVNMKEEVETEIPLEFVGESEAVKAHGGVLIKNMDSIEVKCLPADLPEKYEIDLSKLATFDDVIAVKDLRISDKVEILLDGETVIALVAAPRTEAEMESLEQKVEEDVSKVAGVVKETAAPVAEEKKK
jgi:large subunit ribosomal protein L25